MNLLQAKISKLKAYQGFTLVELLVAITIFVVVMAIASNLFIGALRAQKSVVDLIAVNDNISLALERIGREIRVGNSFSANSSGLIFTIDDRGESNINYSLQNDRLMRSVNGGSASPLTGANVVVSDLKFYVYDNDVPRVTIVITAGLDENTRDLGGVKTTIQTTVSARPL
ncbi:MAG: hypothetical protein COU09_00245 [Candidatus Harrisonbacteria bacterium CG10_big_fil_rev_8_21_14_0_10_44_23]|uniref:Prepilin-type N-terminal cleavage/methylation domain-containing protein n=1 Tax=Candidatus Harrisonbacteria bacterium CG10_big_fil_rev_8_21_14_0_10_44_23 TaxID=1974585 RepID=A0A2H0UR16_9BACT|nr:MAG: hypothetical protein COU09_00245 [Candidatus Harrisonbacteria bacterium CG10_big_fil_rev_8_21_14_0_10_44_23]